MIGRSTDLDRVVSALGADAAVGVLLAGPMGTGKSMLLAAVADAAEHDGADVLRLHASRATSAIPLLVFAALVDEVDETAIRYLALRDHLRERRRQARVVLVIDDAHELDDTSAALVAMLTRERTVCLVGSVRSNEPMPEPIASLWSQGLATRVEITPLARDDATEVASVLLDGPIAPDLEADLWRRAAGNPLHIRELVLGSLEAGALTEIDGVWTRTSALVATDALVDLVVRRLRDLDADAQDLLCAVALAEPAPTRLLERVGSLDALARLEENRLVRIDDAATGPVVRLAHPVYGEGVRTLVSQLRVRGLRRDLARALEADGPLEGDQLIRVAGWRLDADDPDSTLFAVAAFEAIRRYDYDLAARLAESAHAIAPDGRATRALAMTRHLAGRHEDAVAALEDALADPQLDPGEAARMHLLTGLVLARGLGDYEAADRALRCVGGAASATVRARTDAMRALIPLLVGRANDGLHAAEELGRRDAGPEAVTAVVATRAVTGRPEEALAIADEYVESHGEPDARSLFPDFRWVALIDAGGVSAMDAEVAQAWGAAVEDGDRHRQARLAFAMGHVRAERGQLGDAIAWFDRAAALSRSIGERFGVRWARCGQLLAAGQLGDVALAAAAEADLAQVPGHPAELFELYGHRGRAWVAAANGRHDEARGALLELAERILADGCVGHGLRTLVDASRLGGAARAEEVLAAATFDLDGELLPRLVELVSSGAARDATRLGALAFDLESLGYGTLAVGAATMARELLNRRGRDREANSWSQFVHRLEATEGVAPGIHFSVTNSASLLTRREREVAHLVAQGLTSRQVAETCFLSVRTVDNHLSRIYDKLGVRSRHELADALAPLTFGAA